MAKTYLIRDTGEVTMLEKLEHLDEMQRLVKGPIEIVNAAMPKASAYLKDSDDLQEMVCNEEGLFNSSFKTNEKARELIAAGLGVSLKEIQDIRGDVFITDGWRIQQHAGLRSRSRFFSFGLVGYKIITRGSGKFSGKKKTQNEH